MDRILGTYTCGRPGPLLVVSGGVHGNEPSGIEAIRKVLAELERTKPEINGTLLAISGNTPALEAGTRFIDEDLNRAWSEENVASTEPGTSEKRQVQEIVAVLKDYSEENFTKRYFLDCHTTSSPTLPYISVQDVNDNVEWAQRFPTYIIQGFSDLVYGCIDHYLSRIGITGFVFEAGQHEDPSAVDNHEGILWLVLKEACGLQLELLSEFPECVDTFAKQNSPDQKTFEIVERFGLEDEDDFVMEPGFSNFDPVKKDQLLALHNGEKVHSAHDANIFMPLYQAQGNDGFFIVREAEN